jgi:hypothetical protein
MHVDARVVLLLDGDLFLVDCVELVLAVGKYMWDKSKGTEVPGQAREIWLLSIQQISGRRYKEQDHLLGAATNRCCWLQVCHVGLSGAHAFRFKLIRLLCRC